MRIRFCVTGVVVILALGVAVPASAEPPGQTHPTPNQPMPPANPGGHLILLVGTGHCHNSAVINRTKRRGVADAISVRSVIDDGEASVGKALARPINDFLVVLQLPPDVQRADKADDKDKDDTDQDDKPAK